MIKKRPKAKTQRRIHYPVDFAYARGQYVYLRYLTQADARGEWHLWFNSPDITRYMLARRWINTPRDQLEYLKYLKSTRDRLALAVVDIKTNKHIGICSLGSIDYINSHAEVSCLIGNKKFHKFYYALETIQLMTEIGFSRLNLYKIFGVGLENNKAILNIVKLLGYKKSGRYKEHGFIDGKYVDAVIYEIFQKDWLRSSKRPKVIKYSKTRPV